MNTLRFFGALGIVILLSLAACSDTTFIGADLITDSEFTSVEQTDTFSLTARAIKSDSVTTAPIYELLSSSSDFRRPYMLGALNDPVFGRSTASLFTQFMLPSNNIDLGSDLQLDSVVLNLKFQDGSDVYGDANSTVNLQVFEVNDDMENYTVYYSNQSFNYKPFPIGEKTNFNFKPYTTRFDTIITIDPDSGIEEVDLQEVQEISNLRIKLNDELGNRLLNQSGSINFANRANFLQFFKGLYIKTAVDGNAIATFDLLATTSNVTLYYSQGENEELAIAFPINSEVAAINNFSHQYDNTPVGDIIGQDLNETLYLQAMAGVGFSFDIPHLQNLGDVAVNKAELTLTVLPGTNTEYETANELVFTVVKPNDEGTERVTVTPKSVITANGSELIQYKLVFNVYTQRILFGETEGNVNKIFINAQSINPNRVILGGPNHPDYPMKFNVVYSIID